MAKDKSHTVDWKGLNLEVDEINGATPGAAPSTADVSAALAAKTEIAALVSPTADYANLAAATAAIKSVIDALKA